MKRTARSKAKKQIKLLAFAFVIVIGFACCHFHNPRMTGEESFVYQTSYMENMQTISASLDDIVSLYLNGNISDTDYYNHLSVIRLEMDILQKSFEADKTEHPVKIGSHTYDSKAGTEAIENTMNQLSLLINACIDESVYLDKNNLSYTYIAYAMSISDHIGAYTEAYAGICKKYKNTDESRIKVKEIDESEDKTDE